MNPLLAALLAGAPTTCPEIDLPQGLAVPLATIDALSSKTSAKGDLVAMRTTEDVVIGGTIVIPKGTPATGQVSAARGTGGLGTSGRIALRPLYLKLGDNYVRLRGASAKAGALPAGSVVGLLLFPAIAGSSAKLPAGTAVPGEVEKPVRVSPERC